MKPKAELSSIKAGCFVAMVWKYSKRTSTNGKKAIRQQPDCLHDGGLKRQSHLEYGPIAETGERYDHISPEEQDVCSLGKFQISQNDEKRSLQEKQQSHFNEISSKGHEANSQREEAEYPKHACHG